jgi:hypothetical protein
VTQTAEFVFKMVKLVNELAQAVTMEDWLDETVER